jgi:hypothetical protein
LYLTDRDRWEKALVNDCFVPPLAPVPPIPPVPPVPPTCSQSVGRGQELVS